MLLSESRQLFHGPDTAFEILVFSKLSYKYNMHVYYMYVTILKKGFQNVHCFWNPFFFIDI